ncbi:Lrp/AsnC family transcriptional regulator [Natrinema caseinilyticum]|uniref:Lrp/AsnC family transcriptional regulator n=1 Tax=Natrinema caseinilyticum TaxID=2961570 RepID=UPI0020C1E329|nr:Lrp/AsnC ligand binding domain-containing protein [Natrinema caseinilyticum]
MVYAYTTVDAATGTSDEVCEALTEVDGVVDAHVIAGDFDVMIELEGETPHDVLRTVTSSIRPLEGVGTTRTYICID